MSLSTQQKAYIALGLVSFFWGTTYFALRIGVSEIPPVTFTAARQLIAGSLILVYCRYRKIPFPSVTDMLKLSLSGLLLFVGANLLVGMASKQLPSAITALICAFLPFYVIPVNRFFGVREKLNFWMFTGFLIGGAGAVLLFYDELQFNHSINYLWALLVVLIANFLWAIGSVYIKKENIETDPFMMSAIQMISAGIILSFGSFLWEEVHLASVTFKGVASMLYLVFFGSILAYGSYQYCIRHLPMLLVSVYAYVNPVIAFFLGYFFLEESLHLNAVVSLLLTITGLFLVNIGNRKE